jgi:hypothetical protein
MTGTGARVTRDRLLMMPPGAPRMRQESARHIQWTEEIDGEVLLEQGRVAQIVVNGDTGIIDEDVEAIDLGAGLLDLRSVGHIEPDRRHARVGGEWRAARSRMDTLRPASQCFGDQRLADTPVGAGDKYDLVRYVHVGSPDVWKWFR